MSQEEDDKPVMTGTTLNVLLGISGLAIGSIIGTLVGVTMMINGLAGDAYVLRMRAIEALGQMDRIEAMLNSVELHTIAGCQDTCSVEVRYGK